MRFDWNTPRLINSGSSFYPWAILINVIFATIPTVMSGTAGFISDLSVRGTLALSLSETQWIGISYIMMLGLVLPLAIWLAERFGYKSIFFIAIGIFSIASLLNGLSSTFYSFLGSRILAGIGAGAILPIGLSLIDQAFPRGKATLPIAIYVGACLGFGAAVGFGLGGYFAQYASWRDSFFSCFIMTLPSLVLTPFLHRETPCVKGRRFDSFGFLSFVLFLSGLLIILNSGKAPWNTDGWTSSFILSWAIISLLGFFFLIKVELRFPDPILIFTLFKSHSFLLGVTAIFFVGAGYYATQLLFTSLLEEIFLYEKYTVGLFLASSCLTMGIIGSAVGLLATKINIRWLVLSGMLLVIISCWMNQFLSLYSDHVQMLVMLNLRMAGAGVCLGPLTAFALSDIAEKDGGGASMLATFFRQMGGTLGSIGAASFIVVRNVFHNEMYGTQLDTAHPAFQQISQKLSLHLQQTLGLTAEHAHSHANHQIINNVIRQSHVTSLNDSFFAIGVAMSVVFVLFLAEAIWYCYKRAASYKDRRL